MNEKFGCESLDNNADGLNFEMVVQVESGGRKVLTTYEVRQMFSSITSECLDIPSAI
jgi:hypothetical protein